MAGWKNVARAVPTLDAVRVRGLNHQPRDNKTNRSGYPESGGSITSLGQSEGGG